jgi:carboxyl-terminal processing protease
MPIGKDEALKLTVARYYLPSGRTIQAEGVTPDIIIHAAECEQKEDPLFLKERDLKKHLESELEKIDANATVKTIRVDNNDTDDNATKTEENNETIITKDQLFKDAQLKTSVDILKALIIMKEGGK